MSRKWPKVSELLDDFVEGRRGDWEWEETWDRPAENSLERELFPLLLTLPSKFPNSTPNVLCNEAGLAELRRLRDELRLSGD